MSKPSDTQQTHRMLKSRAPLIPKKVIKNCFVFKRYIVINYKYGELMERLAVERGYRVLYKMKMYSSSIYSKYGHAYDNVMKYVIIQKDDIAVIPQNTVNTIIYETNGLEGKSTYITIYMFTGTDITIPDDTKFFHIVNCSVKNAIIHGDANIVDIPRKMIRIYEN